jgi:glyoxylase-like metal-dependent hydrolase (beta-lactamase superfamily II)
VRVPETRRVGDLEVMALTDAAGPFFLPRREAFPAATPADWARADRLDPAAAGPDGGWLLVFRCYTIRGPDGRVILVDTGVGPAGSPASAWAPVPGRLPDRLRDAGIEPGDVDTVVLTHLHGDHTGWSVGPDGAPTFPAARYVLQHDEVAALAALGDSAPLRQVVAPLRAAGQLDELRGRAALAGRRVTAVPTPGHTPGHQSVLVSAHPAVAHPAVRCRPGCVESGAMSDLPPMMPQVTPGRRPAGLTAPAVGLIVAGAVEFLAAAGSLVTVVVDVVRHDVDDKLASMGALEYVAGLVFPIIGLVAAPLAVLAGVSLLRGWNRTVAYAGAIGAMVPGTACCLVGLPFGIWTLVVLSQPAVRAWLDGAPAGGPPHEAGGSAGVG